MLAVTAVERDRLLQKCHCRLPRWGEAVTDWGPRAVRGSLEVHALAMQSNAMNPLGEALGDRYRIEREIGSGGMGTVYLAEDLRHHRKVAVKVLRPDVAAAVGPDRFLREIEIAANLHHPHILQLYDSGEADGFLYFVMPYEQGQSLRERLTREGPLPITDAVRILCDVVDALAHAHEQGIVHRDIKPDNVLVSGRHALVTDFGVSKAVSDAMTRGPLTTAGVAIGTPAYMAPEQAAADPNVDQRADIYAVGVVAYEMLSGQPPFTGGTAQQVLSAQLTQTPQPLSTHRSAVPSELVALVMKCLEKQPADRWQSADELLARLEMLSTPSGGTVSVPIAAAGWKRNVAVAAVALSVLGIVAWQLTRDRIDVDPTRVAVVPFEHRSGDDSLKNFGMILADIISNELTGTGRISVAPSATVLAASRAIDPTGAPVDHKELALETRAGVIVSGSYFVVGDSLSIHTEIIDVRRDRSSPVDLVTVPIAEQKRGIEEVLQRVSVILSSQLDSRDRQAPLDPTASGAQTAPSVDLPMNMAAYDEYMAGLERYEVDDYGRALEHFYRAVRLDSTSGSALNMAALTQWNATFNLPKVDSLLRKLELYESDLPPYDRARHDWLRAWLDGKLMTSLLATRRMSDLSGRTTSPNAQDAIRLNYLDEAYTIREALETPAGRKSSWARDHLTYVLHMRGDHPAELRAAMDGVEEIGETQRMLQFEIRALAALGRTDSLRGKLEKLKALHTASPTFRDAARELRQHGYSAQADTFGSLAEQWYGEALAKTPTIAVRVLLAETMYDLGKWDEARALFDSLAAVAAPTRADTVWQRANYDVGVLGYIGMDEARRRNTAGAHAMIDRLVRFNRDYLLGSNVYWQARIAAELGECERTVDFLEEALALGGSAYYQPGWVGLEVPEFAELECHQFEQFRQEKR